MISRRRSLEDAAAGRGRRALLRAVAGLWLQQPHQRGPDRLGRIAQSHDMPGVIKSELADYLAVCDLDASALADGVKIIEKSYTDRGMSAPKIRTFDNYRELLARKRHRRGGHQHAGSLACRSGAGRGQRRQGRLSTEALHDDARRGRDPARRGEAQRAHPAGGQPAAFLGAVPPRGRADPLGTHRQCATRGDRPAHRSDRARHAAGSHTGRTSTTASG